MIREITSHKINGVNDKLRIVSHDEIGPGGAHHDYEISFTPDDDDRVRVPIQFQNGPLNVNGVNGITHEALLAIVIDRLECFQKGEYSCRENSIAITKLQEALHWLNHRTFERLQRGVEGTMQK